jgi:hypothetical protein
VLQVFLTARKKKNKGEIEKSGDMDVEKDVDTPSVTSSESN